MTLGNLAYARLRYRLGAAGLAFSIVLALSCGPQSAAPARSEETERSDGAALAALVEKYVQSINDVDLALAGEVWLTSDRVSFIYPRGRETGWDAIMENFYGKTMRDRFSKRNLTPRDIAVNLFGDTAVVEFKWTFDATRREDGLEIQQMGRESQVYRRADDEQWKLVHIHYSGPPVAAEE